MPNKITVYARPLFRLVCRANEIMTIGSARMQIELRTHRYRYRYIHSDRYTDAVADTDAWDDADTDTLA